MNCLDIRTHPRYADIPHTVRDFVAVTVPGQTITVDTLRCLRNAIAGEKPVTPYQAEVSSRSVSDLQAAIEILDPRL